MPYDTLNIPVRVTFNKPLGKKFIEELVENFRDAIENHIMESATLTEKIGHVSLESPSHKVHEICI